MKADFSDAFISILKKYENSDITAISEQQLNLVNHFVSFFLKHFSFFDGEISKKKQKEFIALSHVIANLTALSDLRNTDSYVKILQNSQPDYRLLTLYSCRNLTEIDYRILLSVDKELLSTWYWAFFDIDDYTAENNLTGIDRHIDQLELFKEILELPAQVQNITFISTYASPEKDRLLKSFINRKIKEKYHYLKFENSSDRKKIAVFSRYFYPGHPVYRCTAGYIEALAKDYEITFITASDSKLFYSDKIFKNTLYIDFSPETINLESISRNDFSMLFFPDTGISPESVYLSNFRIAPLQVAAHGHPVSTFGSEIDYFISGELSEPLEAEKNYSEKLLLLPGIGPLPSLPDMYGRIAYALDARFSEDTNQTVIICPWSAPKINYYHLLNLVEIQKRTTKKLLFKFFIMVTANVSFLVLKKNLEELLGKENVGIISYLPYEEYLKVIASAALVLDSYPFGGYSTVIDALILKKPVITLQGNKAYNRFAAALLKEVGLTELVTETSEQYIAKTVELLENTEFRSKISNKIKNLSLEKYMACSSEPDNFRQIIKST